MRRSATRLEGVKLIVLNFPKFTDGRAYSQARLLRERLGYTGELRATGRCYIDQLPFMLRCGFDSFESEQKGFARGTGQGAHPVQRRLPADRRRPRHGRSLYACSSAARSPPRLVRVRAARRASARAMSSRRRRAPACRACRD